MNTQDRASGFDCFLSHIEKDIGQKELTRHGLVELKNGELELVPKVLSLFLTSLFPISVRKKNV